MSTVAEMVKAERFSVDQGRYDHLELLERVSGIHVPRGLSTTAADRVSEKGMHWIVHASFVKRFKHHAVVNPDRSKWIIRYVATFFRMELGSEYWSQPKYVGDIPDSILRRAASAKEAGVNFLTVHSNAPFPVQWETVREDPIMLGWFENPNIIVKRGKVTGIDNVQAVVVGIWDAEKEVSI